MAKKLTYKQYDKLMNKVIEIVSKELGQDIFIMTKKTINARIEKYPELFTLEKLHVEVAVNAVEMISHYLVTERLILKKED